MQQGFRQWPWSHWSFYCDLSTSCLPTSSIPATALLSSTMLLEGGSNWRNCVCKQLAEAPNVLKTCYEAFDLEGLFAGERAAFCTRWDPSWCWFPKWTKRTWFRKTTHQRYSGKICKHLVIISGVFSVIYGRVTVYGRCWESEYHYYPTGRIIRVCNEPGSNGGFSNGRTNRHHLSMIL